jgi:hypothetical protein
MATLEISLEEELAQLLSEDDLALHAVEPREVNMLAFEPWKQGSNPETTADAEWLFEVLMV